LGQPISQKVKKQTMKIKTLFRHILTGNLTKMLAFAGQYKLLVTHNPAPASLNLAPASLNLAPASFNLSPDESNFICGWTLMF